MPIDAEQIIRAIRQATPPSAEIQVAPGLASINVYVAWKLNNDPARPNKMSKTIAIQVTHEAAQDFENASAADQANAYGRIARFIAARLASFDPIHDAPRFEPPPVERWFISSNVIVG